MTRKMIMSLVASAVFALVAAVPAVAQTPDQAPAPVSTTPNFQVNGTFMSDSQADSTDFTTSDDQAQPKTHTMGDRQVFVRLNGGLVFCCSNTGFVVGVSVSGQPKSVKNLEIEGGVGFGRFAGYNLLTFTVDGLYDFHMQGHQAMPYAGGGLGITHFANGTNSALELIGGVQLPVSGPHVVRFQIKFLFTTLTTTIIEASYSF